MYGYRLFEIDGAARPAQRTYAVPGTPFASSGSYRWRCRCSLGFLEPRRFRRSRWFRLRGREGMRACRERLCRKSVRARPRRRGSPRRARALRIGGTLRWRVECCAGGAACLVAAEIDDILEVWACKFVKLLRPSKRCSAQVTVEIGHLGSGTSQSAGRVRPREVPCLEEQFCPVVPVSEAKEPSTCLVACLSWSPRTSRTRRCVSMSGASLIRQTVRAVARTGVQRRPFQGLASEITVSLHNQDGTL